MSSPSSSSTSSSSSTFPKSFEIRVGRSTFYAVVERYTSKNFIVHVGGKKKGCVQISVDKAEKPGKNMDGGLNVHYDRRCNTNGDLERGVGTVGMLQAAITFAFAHFPTLTNITLKDQSTVSCVDHGDMDLAPMLLAVGGQSWYMRHVQAEPDDDNDKVVIDRIIKASKEPLGAFDPFWDKSICKRIPNKKDRPVWKRRIQAYWKSPNTTLQELIGAMKEAGECELFKYWLSKYFWDLTGVLFGDVDFIIHRSKFNMSAIVVSTTEFPYGSLLQKNKAALQRKLDFLDSFGEGGKTMRGGKWEGIRYPFGKDATIKDIDDVMKLPVGAF